jgi:DNA-binding transcriptional LysR family regulator
MNAFVRVVEKGSFAAAAQDLSLTPSAVSKIVTRVEQRLGVQLLTRTTRRIALTPEGETYFRRCRDILAAIEAAEAEVASSGTSLQGHIRVSASTSVGRYQIAPILPAFLGRHPGIAIELDATDRQIDLIVENVDVALRTGQLADSSLVARKISEARRIICASPAYLERRGTPAVPADLLEHNCLLVTNFAHLARWPFYTPEGLNRLAVSGDVTSDSSDVLLELALAGHGIIRTLEMLAADHVRRGRLVPLLTDVYVEEPTPIWAVTPPGRNRVPRVRAFLDFLVEQLGGAPWRLDHPAPAGRRFAADRR